MIVNDDTNKTLLFDVVNPDTFNHEKNVILLFNLVKPLTFNCVDNNVWVLCNKWVNKQDWECNETIF